jgi:hypothetical protein
MVRETFERNPQNVIENIIRVGISVNAQKFTTPLSAIAPPRNQRQWGKAVPVFP